MNERRRELVGGIHEYVHNLVNKAVENDWKIIIWGFGRGGKFLRYLIQDIEGGKVSYIIDRKLRYVCDSDPAIYRDSLLDYIDSSKYMVLSSIKDMKQIEDKLLQYGYRKGESLYDVYADIGDSYLDFLHKRNKLVEFESVAKSDMEDFGSEYVEYQPFNFTNMDSVFEKIARLEDNISFFDYGCGKGAAIVMAYMSGINKLGGCEIAKSIYDQCVVNMKELKIDCNLMNEDATKCNIDEYNCLFLYNPFGKTILKKVLSNIRDSYMNKKRKIYFVYANPFFHQCLIEEGLFRLYKQIRTDSYDPILNIYVTPDK